MYFDTFERQEVKCVVKFLQVKDLHDQMERDRSLRAQIFYFLYFVVVVASALFFISWIAWLLVAFIFFVMLSSKKITYEKLEEEFEKRAEDWWQEAEDLDASYDDRRLFCDLIDAIPSGNRREIRHLAKQALKSPALSRLKFVNKLQHYTFKR